MTLLISIFIFLMTMYLTSRFLGKVLIKDKARRKRVEYVENMGKDYSLETGDKSSLDRFIVESAEYFYKTILKISPVGTKDRIIMNLRTSGLYKSFSPSRWIWLKIVIGFIFPIVISLLFIGLEVPAWKIIYVACIFIVTANLGMTIIIKSMIKTRKSQIVKDLPDVMDLVTVSVEAGLSFDGAIDRVINAIDSPVTEEFSIMLKEVRMGKVRKEALREMGKRCDVSDMTTLLGSIIQADELGVSMGNILRIQSKQLREKRRQRAREKSLKAPIKLLFPIIFFIFPTIFVLLLAPVLISMSKVF